MKTVNPTTEDPIREYEEFDDAKVDELIQRAHTAFQTWRETPFRNRAPVMSALAYQLRRRKDECAALMTREMGKPIEQAEGEVDKCAWVCEYYAENGKEFFESESVKTDASQSYVRFDPLGVVLAVMPWNFPFWQVCRFLAPSLMAGNVALLKHASNVTGCSLMIEELVHEAGFPPGVFASLLISGSRASEVVGHPLVRAATLTGSERAGRSLAAAAGKHLKKTVLELGGSDPFIVLADADIAKTARSAAKARSINTGQSCIAAKRFIVEQSILKEFEEAFISEMENLKQGDPTDTNNDLGPLAREDLLSTLDDQVKRSIDAGAKLRLGGKRLDRKGYFYPATVLGDVEPGMPAFDEEVFGPVAAIIAASSAENAVELANQSSLGLGASIWTADIELAQRLAADVESGVVFINEIVKSDPRLPFGGVKDSGYGRELGRLGAREFVNAKTVWVA